MAFGKNKKLQVELLLEGILDSWDSDVIVVRKEDCRMLAMNAAARERAELYDVKDSGCKEGYASIFPSMCKHCTDTGDIGDGTEGKETFDIEDVDGNSFSVVSNVIEWTDGKTANIFFLHDVTEERSVDEKLYNLAYIDQLTGVPNRQKLKEDFEKVAEDIEGGKLWGLIAIFDLDNFKTINDTYGHNTGDVMLRRLTEHLGAEENFKEHLYRLGGDEFVLFYTDEPDRFDSDEAMEGHYKDILQDAFMSYTMPNIEKSCTISMGVAYFPRHGGSYSELLRKADIALYEAKGTGRNNLTVFEDKYERAKKFKDLYINIQPILMQSGRTFGYELIDRGDSDEEDKENINLTEFDRTLDAIGLGEMENEARYFIAYSKQLSSASVLSNLPKDKFVVQVHAPGEVSAKDLSLYRQLRSYGYSIAVTGLTSKNATPELLELVNYGKFVKDEIDVYTQNNIIATYPKKIFIATDVNSISDFEVAKHQGFKLFQGFFFNQPVVTKKTKDIDPLKVNYFRLLQLTSTDDYVDFQEISTVISSDVALSYKLLKLLNSAAVGLRSRISSISMAVAYLGEENLKQWIALLALRGIASDKPIELVRMSLIRAKFGGLIAPFLRPHRDSKHIFLLGMLSLLHIALEKTKEELLDEIPVAEDIRDSLLLKSGPYSDILAFMSNYEYSNWDAVSQFAKDNGLTSEMINDSYIAAVKWCNELMET